MAEVWGTPEKKIVAACAPIMDGDKQSHDKYITSALRFNIRFDGAQRATWVYCLTAPADGEEIEVVQLTSGEYKSYWTVAAKEVKTKPKGGGFGGGGIKPNLTPEQEIMDKAIGHAINSIKNGVVAGENAPLPATFGNLDKVAAWAYKKISEAGKKAE